MDKYAADIELVTAITGGNRDAWAQLAEQFSTVVRFAIIRALHRYGVNPDDQVVADLAGDLMISLVADDFKRLRKYAARCSLRQWLKVVAGNFTIDHLRKRRASVSLNQLVDRQNDEEPVRIELIDDGPTPEEVAEEREIRRELGALLSELNDEDRLFIELFYARDLPFEQVAELMGTTLGAVYARKNRVRKRLTALARDAALL